MMHFTNTLDQGVGLGGRLCGKLGRYICVGVWGLGRQGDMDRCMGNLASKDLAQGHWTDAAHCLCDFHGLAVYAHVHGDGNDE